MEFFIPSHLELLAAMVYLLSVTATSNLIFSESREKQLGLASSVRMMLDSFHY